ncbi:MAG TPA: SDR family oxidoreductase [Acidobacteriaceae bacterium]|jgi:NAD(P)-dependent dehydrogenase (short-subunit alcohol dehydrogenase family)|nr:SDR family oxidoreductase [Acidobacteriaceae bacterium]
MAPLDSQIAVVTGAARGVGEAISLRLASVGAHVLLVARDTKRLNAVRERIQNNHGQGTVYPCDLTNAAAVARLGEQIASDHKRCDILVNNAGISSDSKPLHEVSPEEWDRLFATNLRAPYLMIRAIAPLMIAARAGHIINISSLAGRNPLPNLAPYAASKWGLNGLTYSVAEELRPYNIRVSVIAPGSINTHFGDGASGKDPNKKLQPDDVASVVASIVTQPAQSFISEVLLRPTQKP